MKVTFTLDFPEQQYNELAAKMRDNSEIPLADLVGDKKGIISTIYSDSRQSYGEVILRIVDEIEGVVSQ